jgi:hypothetical protein
VKAVNRRIAAVVMCVSVLIGLCGCNSILNGETQSVTAHQEPAVTSTDSIIEANTFDELKSDFLNFVRSHDETGLIRVYSYSGDVQKDVDLACTQIMQDDPIAAYAVSKMTGNATKIVSYYEVELHISYKNVTKEQLDSIIPVATTRYLKSDLQDTLSAYMPSMTILTKNIILTSDDALAYVEQIYYENPMDIVMLPVTTVDFYPDHGIDHIIKFTFGYRYEPSTLKVMEKNLKNTVQNIAESVSGGNNDGAILLSVCQHLMATVEYDSSTAANGYSNQNVSATAYGALVTGSAVGEGYAMAYKAICDELGIESYVVLGKHNGKPHAWNIVAIEGHYYHIDVSMCDLNGISTAFLLDDAAMIKNYTWDTTKYKACNGPLSYKSF